MNTIKTTNPRRLMIFGIILAILLIVLLIWAREIIHEMIVLPLSYLLWAFKIILYIVPETYFWMGAVAIGLMIAWRAISGKPPSSKDSSAASAVDSAILAMTGARSRSMVDRPVFGDRQALNRQPQSVLAEAQADERVKVNRGRVAFWQTKVSLVRQGASAYYQSMFHVTLALLLLDMLAHRYRLTPSQVEERLRLDPKSERGQLFGLAVPEDVREYILSRLRFRDLESKPFWTRLWENIGDFIHDLGRSLAVFLNGSKNVPAIKVDPHVERIIKYMEEELEVPNDNNGR